MTTSTLETETAEPATKIRELRFYNSPGGILIVIFVTNPNGVDSLQISDPVGNCWHESNRGWLTTYFPQIKTDVKSDPVDDWTW